MDVIALGFRTDLALLKLGGTRVDDQGDYLVIRTPDNPTFWWGNFLLLATVPQPADCELWLHRFASAFPGAEHVALGVDSPHGARTDMAWFADHGFDVDVSTVMTATAVHPPAHGAPGALYRRLDSDADWAQSLELTLRCHGFTAEDLTFSTAKSRTNRALAELGRGGWFGAFVDGRLVAQMGLLTAGPGLARFQAVETDPEHRRQGFAGSLVHHVSRFGFATLEAQKLVMVADPDYHAIDLYRAVGFEPTETQLQAQRRPLVPDLEVH